MVMGRQADSNKLLTTTLGEPFEGQQTSSKWYLSRHKTPQRHINLAQGVPDQHPVTMIPNPRCQVLSGPPHHTSPHSPLSVQHIAQHAVRNCTSDITHHHMPHLTIASTGLGECPRPLYWVAAHHSARTSRGTPQHVHGSGRLRSSTQDASSAPALAVSRHAHATHGLWHTTGQNTQTLERPCTHPSPPPQAPAKEASK